MEKFSLPKPEEKKSVDTRVPSNSISKTKIPTEKQYELMFATMRERIDEINSEIEDLEKVIDDMREKPEVFEPSDIDEFELERQEKVEKLKSYQTDYCTKRNYYDSVILRMERQLEEREKILEKHDQENGVLLKNPKLKKRMVEKQNELKSYFHNAHAQLFNQQHFQS